jgi:hypothetical protein
LVQHCRRLWRGFSAQAEIAGPSLYVGSPETVATKLEAAIRLLGLSRFDLAGALGRVPHEQRMATIKLYGRDVIPRVGELVAAAPDAGDAHDGGRGLWRHELPRTASKSRAVTYAAIGSRTITGV